MADGRGALHDLHLVAGTSSTEMINNLPDDLVVYADASLFRRLSKYDRERSIIRLAER